MALVTSSPSATPLWFFDGIRDAVISMMLRWYAAGSTKVSVGQAFLPVSCPDTYSAFYYCKVRMNPLFRPRKSGQPGGRSNPVETKISFGQSQAYVGRVQ